MFSPITAFDSDICLIRLKRGMRSDGAQRGDEVAPLAGDDRGGAEGDQPPAGPQQPIAAPEALAADRVEDHVERRQAALPARCGCSRARGRPRARRSARACRARPCRRPRRRCAWRSASRRCRRRRRRSGSARARPACSAAEADQPRPRGPVVDGDRRALLEAELVRQRARRRRRARRPARRSRRTSSRR